jgi:hypothetical protein
MRIIVPMIAMVNKKIITSVAIFLLFIVDLVLPDCFNGCKHRGESGRQD